MQSKTVLIVDDERASRAMLQQIFSDEYRVLIAGDGQTALTLLRCQEDVSLVALSLPLPAKDDLDVLGEITGDQQLSRIPVVVVTGEDDEYNQLWALDRGALDVITRPFNSQVVLHRVRNILARMETERIAEQNRLYERQLRLSELDATSGVFNKQTFCRHTAELLAAEPDREHVVLRWDIDRFKVYNDTFGVPAGDALLGVVGAYCRGLAGWLPMSYGRWEADHFVFCMERALFEREGVSERLLHCLNGWQPNFEFVSRMGVYVVEDPTLDVALMCDRALLALRSIKGNYGTRVAYYSDSMRAKLLEEQEFTSEMSAALASRQFVLYLQPQYSYSDGSLLGAEALVRWMHPTKGLVAPAKFIPAFEKNGFISQLDEYVWEEACALLRRWADLGLPETTISVNISRRDIYNPHLCEKFVELVQHYALDPSMLHLEITESAYMENPDQLIKVVTALRAAGFHVEMDDFGSGYSSLNTLKDVPVDMLKLDMKFLAQGNSGERGGGILSYVVRMAHWIRLPVIAEGVETREQADYLKSIGCLLMQGYYFARPMPVEAFEALLRDSRPVGQGETLVSHDLKGAANFFDASTQSTLLFNSFVGGAAIVEYSKGNVEALRLNDRFFEVIGATRAEYTRHSLHLLDRFDPSNRAIFLHLLQSAVDTGQESACELSALPLHRGAETNWLHLRARYLASNVTSHILYVAVENITERRKLTAHNEELSDQLSAITANVPGGIVNFEVVGHEVHTAYFNDMACAMFGYSREEYAAIYGRSPLLAVHPDDRPAVVEEMNRVLDGLVSSMSVRYRHASKRDGWRWVQFTGRVLQRTPRVVRASAIQMDIDAQVRGEQTARRQEEELQRQRAFQQSLYAAIPCGVLLFSAKKGDDRLLRFNEAAWRLFGYVGEAQYIDAMRGQSRLKDVHPDDVAMVADAVRRALEGDERVDISNRVIRVDGSVRWVRALMQKIRASSGEDVLQCVLTDITALRQDDLRRYSSALFAAFDEVWEVDVERDVGLLVSSLRPEAQVGVSYPFRERLAHLFAVSIHHEDAPKLHAFLDLFNEKVSRKPKTVECRYFDREGSMRWVSATLLHAGGPVWFIGAKEITAEKLAAALARENAALHAAARERKAEEERSRILVDCVGVFVYDYDPARDELRVRYRQPDGSVVEEMTDRYLETLDENVCIHPDDRGRVRALIMQLCRAPMRANLEYLANRLGAGYAPCTLEAVSVADGSGTVYRIVGMMSESPQEGAAPRAEAPARELPAVPAVAPILSAAYESDLRRFSRALTALCDEVIELDFRQDTMRFLFRFGSKRREESPPRALGEALDCWLERYVNPDDREAYRRLLDPRRLRQACAADAACSLEYRLLMPDGAERRCQSVLLRIDDDRYYCCNRDVTEQHVTERMRKRLDLAKETKRSEERYRAVERQLKLAVVEWDFAAHAFYHSDAFLTYEISRRDPFALLEEQSALGRELVHPDDQAALDALRRSVAGREPHVEALLRLKTRDGGYRWTGVTLLSSSRAEDAPPHIIGAFADRSEAEDALTRSRGANRRLYQIIASMPFGVALCERRDGLLYPLYANRRACEMLGYTSEESSLQIVNAEPVAPVPELTAEQEQALREGRVLELPRLRVPRRDGGELWARAVCAPVDRPDAPDAVCITLEDITGTVSAAWHAEWIAERYRLLSEHPGVATFDYDPDEDMLSITMTREETGVVELTEASYLATVDTNPGVAQECRAEWANALRAALREPRTGTLDLRIQDAHKALRWYRVRYQSLTDDQGRVCRIVGRLDDESERVAARQADKLDGVTGLRSKDSAQKLIERDLAGRPADRFDALLFLDLDNFGAINDAVGHLEGDRVLRVVGRVLQGLFRGEDTVARFGGDEFLIYMRGVGGLQLVRQKAGAIIRALEKEERLTGLHCSIGAVGVTGDARDFETLFRQADSALYVSKHTGKNRYTVYDPQTMGAAVGEPPAQGAANARETEATYEP